MKSKCPLSLFTGITAFVIYLSFTLAAFLMYPGQYGPVTNWLSDLGNPLENQYGALVYNLGCILTSVVLVLFFFGLREWISGDKKLRILLAIAQVSGLLSSIFLIMAALFPLGSHSAIHAVSGKLHVIFLGFFFTFSATALLKHPASIKWFAYFGFAGALANFIYGAFLYSVFIAEWVAIGIFIIYVLMISYNYRYLPNEEFKTNTPRYPDLVKL
jgi:hypothetical protein